MTYTGDVAPGGPADTREAGDLLITKVAVDPEMSNNCYLLRCVSTGDQVLIDAAAEPSTLLPLIGEAGLTHVVTTHQHWDHHRALADVVAATGAEVVAGAPDATAITEQTGVAVDPERRGRRHDPRRVLLAARDPADRPHARLDRPPVRRRLRPAAPVHRRLAVPGGPAGQQTRGDATTSVPSGRRGGQGLRRRCPTRPGSTPAMATTRRSVSSAPTCRSGGTGDGEEGSSRIARPSEADGPRTGCSTKGFRLTRPLYPGQCPSPRRAKKRCSMVPRCTDDAEANHPASASVVSRVCSVPCTSSMGMLKISYERVVMRTIVRIRSAGARHLRLDDGTGVRVDDPRSEVDAAEELVRRSCVCPLVAEHQVTGVADGAGAPRR